MNRAWLQKDLKGWDFQQIGELIQIVACRTVKLEALGSLPSGSNTLQLDYFSSLETCDSVESVESKINCEETAMHY